MRAAIYCRVSTDEQRERQSIDAQVEYAKEYCMREGIDITDFYKDNGVSGSVAFVDRTQGARLVSDAASGYFDTVLVYMFDRFARDVFEGLAAVRMLEDKRVRVKSMTEPFDTSDSQGLYMFVQSLNNAQLWKSQYRQRSMDSTVRLVADGVWMGGICPFGYRVEGKDRNARIVPSEEPIPGLDVSEAEVVRMMYHWLADEKRSCYWVCERLTELGVPPAYVSAGRELKKNTRKQATTGIWRPARIRNLIVNTTYKGIHEWGKRSASGKTISRAVPALIDEETWRRAQATLRENQIMSSANRKHDYLLRGLVKCELCGLNFSGQTSQTTKGEKSYYRCNGRQAARGIYGNLGKKCPSRSIPADEVEGQVWSDIERYLRNPGETIAEITAAHHDADGEAERLNAELKRVQSLVKGKEAEREKVISLFRKNIITETDVEKQMADIQKEEIVLKQEARHIDSRLRGLSESRDKLHSAEALLKELGRRLDDGLTWEERRAIVEALVEHVIVDSEPGREEVYVKPRYCFSGTVIHRDMGSSRLPE